METHLQINHQEVKIEINDSIRLSMEKFFKNLTSDFSLYFTLTFKDIFKYHCKKCVNEFYAYGKPTKHWHNVSYGYVNNFAREFADYFPKSHRLIVVEGSQVYSKINGINDELMRYLNSDKKAKRGDSNYKNISSGKRPHIHGVVHGYDKEMFQAILMASKYIKPAVNLSPVKDCSCTCCLNWDKHEHIRSLEYKKYFDPMVQQYISNFYPIASSTNTSISCHLYSPQPAGFYQTKIVKHDRNTERVIAYLYKYLYKDLKLFHEQGYQHITSYETQEGIDSKLKIY